MKMCNSLQHHRSIIMQSRSKIKHLSIIHQEDKIKEIEEVKEEEDLEEVEDQ
jgi:hypothetical protein